MTFVVTPYVALYAATGLVAATVTAVAWWRRRHPGARAIAFLLASVAWWGVTGAVELGAVGIEAKVFWSKVCYVGTLAAPIGILTFAFEMRQMSAWLRPARLFAISVVPLLTVLLAFTNDSHGLIWNRFSPGPPGSNLIVYGHGVGFWIGAVGYSYVCIAAGSLLLFDVALQFSRHHRWRMAVVLVGIALPWIGNFIYIAGLSPMPLDLAPIAMAGTGALFLWVLVGSRLSELVPIAALRAIERLPDAVLVVDAVDRVAELNPVAREWCGFDRPLRADDLLEQVLPADRSWHALVTMPVNTRCEFQVANPEARVLEAESIELTSMAGDAAGRLLIVRDITARKQAEAVRLELERRASRAERDASLGLFAGGVAHDFNNLMAVVLARLSLADSKIPATSSARLDLREAERAGHRVADLTRQILLYAGAAHGEQSRLDLGGPVRAVVQDMKAGLPAHLQLDVTIASELPEISGNVGQIEVVCRSLITNAVEAMGGLSGTITVKVWTEAEGATPDFEWKEGVPTGRYVAIEVGDVGSGMDKYVRARMFEPFFTTKFMGRGLGLAAVWGVVRGHCGWIGVASSPGRGTRVRLAFPIGSAIPTKATEGRQEPSAPALG